jgi:hypothetical protein
MTELTDYKYRGARALVLLHEQYLSEFYDVWREAKEADLRLPQVDDPDYESLDHVLRHVLRAARGYMTWMCQVLGLPDPEIRATPEVERIESEAVDYLDHVLEQWRVPLSQVDEKSFNTACRNASHPSHFSASRVNEEANQLASFSPIPWGKLKGG